MKTFLEYIKENELHHTDNSYDFKKNIEEGEIEYKFSLKDDFINNYDYDYNKYPHFYDPYTISILFNPLNEDHDYELITSVLSECFEYKWTKDMLSKVIHTIYLIILDFVKNHEFNNIKVDAKGDFIEDQNRAKIEDYIIAQPLKLLQNKRIISIHYDKEDDIGQLSINKNI